MMKKLACALVVLTMSAQPALADDQVPITKRVARMSLEDLMSEEVVFAASKIEQKPSEAASSVTIITAQEIRQFGYRTIQDVLNAVRGFYTTYDRNYSYIGVRGFGPPHDYNSRVLVLLDGHRLNENMYDGAYIGTDSPFDMTTIDRVEIVRGPGSSVYGSNAVFGVVNFVTKTGEGAKGAEVSAEAGSFGAQSARAVFGQHFTNGTDVLASASGYASDGQSSLYFPEYDDGATSNGLAVGADADDFQRFFAKVSRGNWTVSGLRALRDKRIPTAAFGTVFNDPRTSTRDVRQFVDATYRGKPDQPQRVFARVAFDDYEYFGDYVYDYGTDGEADLVINKDWVAGTWLTGEVHMVRRLGLGHRVMGGSEYRENIRQDQRNYDREVYLDDRRRSRTAGVFVQDDWTLSRKISLSFGLRHDWYQSFGGTTNPRLAAVYTPNDRTTVKWLYGRAFRAPNVFEFAYASSASHFSANPDLGPEKISTTEVVVERRLNRGLWITGSAYVNNLRDLIRFVEVDGTRQAVNTSIAEARGIEVEGRGQWANGVSFRASYGAQVATTDAGATPANSPRHITAMTLRVPLGSERLAAGVQTLAIGSRLSETSAKIPAAATTNITVVWSDPRWTRLTVAAGVYNAFDQEVFHPVSDSHRQDRVLQDGRTWRFTAYMRF